MIKSLRCFLCLILMFNPWLTFAETVSDVNEETQAFQQCQEYAAAAKEMYPAEPVVDCKLMNYSPQQWLCLQNKRLKLKVKKNKAIAQCITSAPAVNLMKQQQVAVQPIKPSAACITAFTSFAKFYPGDDRLALLSKKCSQTTKSTIEWNCMNKFAEAGNSYNYAAGQCLPRAK